MNATTPEMLAKVINPTPKTRFQLSNDNITKHRTMIDSREFMRASDFALLEYMNRCRKNETNPTVLGLKLVGAQEFLDELKLLSEKLELKPLPRVDDNLKPQ